MHRPRQSLVHDWRTSTSAANAIVTCIKIQRSVEVDVNFHLLESHRRLNAMHRNLLIAFVPLIAVSIIGCGTNSSNGPLRAPKESPLLEPYNGRWMFEFEKTLDAQSVTGVTDEQISQLRKLYANNPAFGKMHSDLTFDGNMAVGEGLLSPEYRFFGMHKHGEKICGKAWHHEDRHDPGDMSKCYVRLGLVGDELRMEVHMQDGLPELDDPDLISEPAVEGDASDCDVDTKVGNKPGDWATYVFTRSL